MGDLSGKRILDIGCGTGTLVALIKQAHPSADIVGLDGDPQILEIARAKAQNQKLEIRFDPGMSFDLPYPDELFDVVCTSMMLHHLTRDDKQKTAMEMYRVLRRGGKFFGVDFTEPRSHFGKAIRPLTRYFERVADNVDGFLPVMFQNAGFRNYMESQQRYLFGSIASFQGIKS
jgi:ubiquinone/menaquinone biosynthesis C-methylase UbiE